jgi:hypothetical protein
MTRKNLTPKNNPNCLTEKNFLKALSEKTGLFLYNMKGRGVFRTGAPWIIFFLNRMNSRQRIVKKEQDIVFKYEGEKYVCCYSKVWKDKI